jgi:hypothetical protein
MLIVFWIPALVAILMLVSAFLNRNIHLAITGTLLLLVALIVRFFFKMIEKNNSR